MRHFDDLTYAFRQWISAGSTLADNVHRLARVELPKFYAFHFAMLILRSPIDGRLGKYKKTAVVKQVDSVEGNPIFELIPHFKDEVNDPVLPFRITHKKNSPLAVLSAICTASQWANHFDKLLEFLHPNAFRPFLRQSELRKIFISMSNELADGLHIRLTKVSTTQRLLPGQSRRRYASGIVWTDIAPDDAFGQAADTLTYFKRISFEVCEGEMVQELKPTGIEGAVTRHAHFAVSKQPHWLFLAVIEAALARAQNDLDFATNRGRLQASDRVSTVMTAQFSDGVVFNPEDAPRIAKALQRMPHTSISVLNGERLHVTLVDMRDGSAFDIVSASDRRLLILPHLRATEAAVTRLCGYIYDEIGEANFVDASIG